MIEHKAQDALYLGVDPGATGGWALLGPTGGAALFGEAEWQPETNPRLLHPRIVAAISNLSGRIVAAAVEEPVLWARGRQIPKSLAAVAFSAGTWVGALGACGVRCIELVNPRRWQAALLGRVPVGQTKSRAEMLVRHLWDPTGSSLITERGRIRDGLVDALLIAEWLRQREVSKCA